MELKLFVSGVPSGENLWGDTNVSSYFGTLYVSSKENMKFDIRLNKTGAKIYAYYHYLVYNYINDYDGRTGSYFGLTIRLDSFCSDYRTIYNVLDILYRKKIVGTILKEVNGGRLQYTCPSFDKRDAELQELEKSARSMLGTSLSSTDFMNIPSMPSGKGQVRLSWEDAVQNSVVQAVGQYAFCSISSEYESLSLSARLKEEFQRGAISRQSEINRLTGDIQDANKKNENLKNEIVRLQKPLKNPSFSSSHHEHRHHHYDEYNEDKGGDSQKTTNYIMGGLLLIIVLILGYYGLSLDDTSEVHIIQQKEIPNDSVFNVYDIRNQKELCPSAIIQVQRNQETISDENVSYIINVSGLDDYADKQCLTSMGTLIMSGSNQYELNECNKDSDLVVVFVTTNKENKKLQNLKSITIKNEK